MKNRDKILQTCPYDMLMAIEKHTHICPIHIAVGLSRENKIMRCSKYVHTGCEQCVQDWLNEDFSTDFSHNCYNSTV